MTAAQPPIPELILWPSRWQTALRTAFCFFMTAVYAYHLQRVPDSGLLWFFGIGFALLTAQGLWRCLDRRACLRLTAQGFAMIDRHSTLAFHWDEVQGFRAAGRRLVVFDFVRQEGAMAARHVARFLAGGEGALPDTYGMTAVDLARVLNEWRERAASK